jgi:putative transposase
MIDTGGSEWPVSFLIHYRNAKFSAAFDEVFRTEGIRVIRTPFMAPNANAHAERFVRTLREECLDWLLILGRRHLERVYASTLSTATASAHTEHSSCERPSPATDDPAPPATPNRRQPPRPSRRDSYMSTRGQLSRGREFVNPTAVVLTAG